MRLRLTFAQIPLSDYTLKWGGAGSQTRQWVGAQRCVRYVPNFNRRGFGLRAKADVGDRGQYPLCNIHIDEVIVLQKFPHVKQRDVLCIC